MALPVKLQDVVNELCGIKVGWGVSRQQATAVGVRKAEELAGRDSSKPAGQEVLAMEGIA